MMATRDPAVSLWLGRALIVSGWLMILGGLGLFGMECLMWLRDGFWTRANLADAWGHLPPGGGTRGWDDMRGLYLVLYEALRWLGRIPLSLALIAVGLALAWSGSGCHDRAEQRLARRHPPGRPAA